MGSTRGWWPDEGMVMAECVRRLVSGTEVFETGRHVLTRESHEFVTQGRRFIAKLSTDVWPIKVFTPRLIGVLIAALTDFYTARLSAKVLGSGSSAGAVSLCPSMLRLSHGRP